MKAKVWDPGESLAQHLRASIYDAKHRTILRPIASADSVYRVYHDLLEENCPPLLRTMPHVATKGISEFELQQLGAVLVGDEAPPARFVDCREGEGTIGSLQSDAVPILAQATQESMSRFTDQWCERLEIHGPTRRDDMNSSLSQIVALARDAIQRSASVFSHTRL